MQEIIDQLLIYLKGLSRAKFYIIGITWVICLLGWFAVWKLPDQYQSSARVFVDTQSLLKPLLRGLTVQTNSEQEIRLMVRTLFSRPNLEKIARNSDLDIHATTAAEYEMMIEKLKKDLSIASAGREDIYSLAYTSNNPDTAKNVIQATLAIFIENTLGESRNDNDAVKSFLDQQIRDYEKRLLDAEQKITEFRQQNVDVLKGDIGSYYGMLEAEKRKLDEALLQLNEVQTRLASARSQLKGEEPSFGLFQPSTPSANITTEYDARIDSFKKQLDQLSLRFTDAHPDVKELKFRIEQLEKLRQDRLAEVQQQMQSNPNLGGTLDSNPVYQEIKLSVGRLESEAASLQVRVANYQSKVKELEGKVHLVPEVEAQLVSLNRGYDITRNKYNELLTRREQARLSQEADLTTDDIQFKVIDPPRKPLDPSGPNRPVLISLVTVFGFAAGLAVALLISQIRPVVFSISQLPDFPVFGYVSKLPPTRTAVIANITRKALFYMLFFGVLIAYGAIMYLQMTARLL